MENVEERKNKFNLKFWIPLISGIVVIALGVVVFVAIYASVPNLVLIKNDYDVLRNPDKKELKKTDVYYSPLISEDAGIFEIGTNYVTLDLKQLRDDNPNFIFDTYYLGINFYILRNPGLEVEKRATTVSCYIDGSAYKLKSDSFYKEYDSTIEKIEFSTNNLKARIEFTNVSFSNDVNSNKFDFFDVGLYGLKK